jgi:competence protein ComEC
MLLKHGGGNWWVRGIMGVKQRVYETIVTTVPEPHASLFYALNFGPRGGIPDGLYQDFQTTGTTHLIAISGSNMSIIIGMLSVLATHLYIPRRKAFWLITGVLASYIIMIGFPASALRAVLMGWTVLLAQHLGRLPQSGTALLLVAVIMTWCNPLVVRDDLGFQLSFLAVIGLLYFSDAMAPLVSYMPEQFGIREALQMTLAAQITTTPLLLYNFGKLSLIAPIANIFLVPVLGYLVIAGLPLVALAATIPSMGHWLLWPVYLLIEYQIRVTELLAALPWATIMF